MSWAGLVSGLYRVPVPYWAVRPKTSTPLEAKSMRTPLKTAVSVLFYIDAFMWLIGAVPTLQRIAMTLNRAARWTHEGVFGYTRRER